MAWTEEEQIKCYGATENMLKEHPEVRLTPADDIRYAMNIISDAQYMLSMAQNEKARQFMNRAKFYMDRANQEIRQMERDGAFDDKIK